MPTNPSNGSFRRMGSKAGRYEIPDTGKAIWEYLRDHVETTAEAMRIEMEVAGKKTVRKHTARAATQAAVAEVPSSRASSPPKVGYGGWVSGGTVKPTSAFPPRISRPSKARGSAGGAVEFLNENKGQSKNWITKIFAPRNGLREGAADDMRIGAGKIGSMGLRTFLSNYGGQKDFSNSLAGASASRFKAMKGLVNRPDTWMGRFAVIWFAQEAGKAMAEWRGWNKVSWQMTDAQAQATLSKHQKPDLLNFTFGKAWGAGLRFASTMTDYFLGYGATVGLISDVEGAQASSLVDSTTSWLMSGMVGPSPWKAVANVNANFEKEVERQRTIAAKKAEDRFYEMIDHNIDRMKDTLALRGVGNRTEIRSAYARSNQERLSVMVGASGLGVDPHEIRDKMLNRELAKGKR